MVLGVSSTEVVEPWLIATYNLDFPADWVDLGHCLNLARVIPKRRHHDATGKTPLRERDPPSSKNAKRGTR